MNKANPRQVAELLARWIVGGVLLYAGLAKALGPAAEFAANVEAYKILPGVVITPFSQALPWIEIWIGLFLITGFHTLASARAATALFTMFLIALASSLIRHLDLASCGCFGPESLSPRQTIVGDVVLLALAVALSVRSLDRPLYSLDPWLNKP